MSLLAALAVADILGLVLNLWLARRLLGVAGDGLPPW